MMRLTGNWKKLLIGGVAAGAIAVGSMTALAQTGGAAEPPADEQETVDPEEHELERCELETFEPSPEEIAEIRAENDALRAAFDAAGIAYTIELDEDLGIEFMEWDYDDDRANQIADAALDEFWHGVDVAEQKAENDALRAAFDAAGIAYEIEFDADHGVEFVEWDYEDDRANELAEAVFTDLYGDEMLGPVEIAEIEAETDALGFAFDAEGISYIVIHDNDLGVRFIEWEWDDDYANEVADEVFADLYGDDFQDDCFGEFDDPSAEEIAEWQEVANELGRRLEAEGIAFEFVEDEYGVRFPEWDEADDERAFAILEEVAGHLIGYDECDVELDHEESAA